MSYLQIWPGIIHKYESSLYLNDTVQFNMQVWHLINDHSNLSLAKEPVQWIRWKCFVQILNPYNIEIIGNKINYHSILKSEIVYDCVSKTFNWTKRAKKNSNNECMMMDWVNEGTTTVKVSSSEVTFTFVPFKWFSE